jgi:hypothetical protein
MTLDTRTAIYLCHKCEGNLEQSHPASAYGCRCISGYIRDWQKPVPLNEVAWLQLEACRARQALYTSQGRPNHDAQNRVILAKLEIDTYYGTDLD